MMKFKIINTTCKLWRVQMKQGRQYPVFTDLVATSDIISVPYPGSATGDLVAVLTDDQTAWWDVSAGGQNVTLQDNVTYVFDGRNDIRYPMQIIPDELPPKPVPGPSLLKMAAPVIFVSLFLGGLIWGAKRRKQ